MGEVQGQIQTVTFKLPQLQHVVGMESAAQIKNKLCMTWLSEATGERAKQRQGPWPNPKGLESEREGGPGAKHEGGAKEEDAVFGS